MSDIPPIPTPELESAETLREHVQATLNRLFSPNIGESIFATIGIAGSDYHLELLSLEPIPVTQIGIPSIGETTHHARLFKASIKLKPTPQPEDYFAKTIPAFLEERLLNLNLIGLLDIIEVLIKGINSPDDQPEFELLLFCKYMDVQDLAETETEGHQLMQLLRMPHLTCLAPLPAVNYKSRQHMDKVSITIAIKGAAPLNLNPDLFGGDKIFARTLNTLAVMHSNLFTHGDGQLKNFLPADSDQFVLPIDFEGSTNFRQIQFGKNPSKIVEAQRFVDSLERRNPDFKNLPLQERDQLIIEEAVLNDLRLLLHNITVSQRNHGAGYSANRNLVKTELVRYLNRIQQPSRILPIYSARLEKAIWQVFDEEWPENPA